MTQRKSISTSASRLILTLLLLLSAAATQAQGFLKLEKDSIPLFRGFSVSFDLVGFAQMQLSDHGEYEGAFRLNLHDQYFPIVEVGLGRANHDYDDVTELRYKTSAPYFRVGIDFNIMKRKHTGNRIFVGVRYGYTNYKIDVSHKNFVDPYWKTKVDYSVEGLACYQHWGELVFGLDAKIAGPLHLGWSGRYRFRMSHDEGDLGSSWYVPGFGIQDSSVLGANFNVIIDI